MGSGEAGLGFWQLCWRCDGSGSIIGDDLKLSATEMALREVLYDALTPQEPK